MEDEAKLQKLVKRMLSDLGYMVLTAGSAKEALQIYEVHGHEIRLVITDVIMPQMNGRDPFCSEQSDHTAAERRNILPGHGSGAGHVLTTGRGAGRF